MRGGVGGRGLAMPLVAAVGALEEAVAHAGGRQALAQRAAVALAGVAPDCAPVLRRLQVGVEVVILLAGGRIRPRRVRGDHAVDPLDVVGNFRVHAGPVGARAAVPVARHAVDVPSVRFLKGNVVNKPAGCY